MATETLISPGTFVKENDLSFLPVGIANIGGAFIGPASKGAAFVPTIVNSQQDFVNQFGPLDQNTYLPYAVTSYLKNAASATVTRILGLSGYSFTYPIMIYASGSGIRNLWGKKLVSALLPTYVVTTDNTTTPVKLFEKSTTKSVLAGGSFVLQVSGSYVTDTSTFTNATNQNGTSFSCSINPTSANYIGDVFGYSAKGLRPVYNYVNFKNYQSQSLSGPTGSLTKVVFATGSTTPDWNFLQSYSEAITPWITSQKIGGKTTELFRLHTISHGDSTNYEIKVGIQDIQPAGTIPGSQYGQFSLIIRAVDQTNIYNTPYSYTDTDSKPTVLESFTNLTLDPNSPNFINRVIGDQYKTVASDGTLTVNGNYPNASKFVWVESTQATLNGGNSPTLVPFGFEALLSPIPKTFSQPPSCSFVAKQQINSVWSNKAFWGFSYDFSGTDNLNYLKPIPVSNTTGSNVAFYLGNFNQDAGANYPSISTAYSGALNLNTAQTSIDSLKFMIPFQQGFNGYKPNVQKRTGQYISATNLCGFDLTSGKDGYKAYQRSINTLSNQDVFDINMLVTPGVLLELHSAVTNLAAQMCEDRGDCFYLMDAFQLTDSVASATTNTNLTSFDNNYAATYYPWMKIMDTNINKPIWVPPSVLMAGVIAFNDKVAQPWNAPAGLNRGGITDALDTYTNLQANDKDNLYLARINPIVKFPGIGVVAWGQKTLQAKPSALDRISVRRLLIAAKKFIASSTRYLVFEQNTTATRNRFLAIVNPYLQSVQQKNGLYAFRVRMDDTNNDASVIDRNMLVGDIYLQPTKTSEFILINLNITPTGATFSA